MRCENTTLDALVRRVASYSIPALDAFAPSDVYIHHNPKKKSVQFRWLTQDFVRDFLSAGKSEAPVGAAVFRFLRTQMRLETRPLAACRGTPMTLGQLHYLLWESGFGSGLALLNQKPGFLLFAADAAGAARLLKVRWVKEEDGWHVLSYDPQEPHLYCWKGTGILLSQRPVSQEM